LLLDGTTVRCRMSAGSAADLREPGRAIELVTHQVVRLVPGTVLLLQTRGAELYNTLRSCTRTLPRHVAGRSENTGGRLRDRFRAAGRRSAQASLPVGQPTVLRICAVVPGTRRKGGNGKASRNRVLHFWSNSGALLDRTFPNRGLRDEAPAPARRALRASKWPLRANGGQGVSTSDRLVAAVDALRDPPLASGLDQRVASFQFRSPKPLLTKNARRSGNEFAAR
jgi:hypothetical protein